VQGQPATCPHTLTPTDTWMGSLQGQPPTCPHTLTPTDTWVVQCKGSQLHAHMLTYPHTAMQVDIYGHVVEFNGKVAALYAKRLKADTQMRVFELQAVSLAEAVEELHATNRARVKVS